MRCSSPMAKSLRNRKIFKGLWKDYFWSDNEKKINAVNLTLLVTDDAACVNISSKQLQQPTIHFHSSSLCGLPCRSHCLREKVVGQVSSYNLDESSVYQKRVITIHVVLRRWQMKSFWTVGGSWRSNRKQSRTCKRDWGSNPTTSGLFCEDALRTI